MTSLLVAAAVISLPEHSPSIQDLHRDYRVVFPTGNRNAASHLWVNHILSAAPKLSPDTVTQLLTGFCAVSGSPVRPSDYNRYRLTLPSASGGNVSAFMHYCCWPCVCDVQDFVLADTKTVATSEGPRTMWWAVLGDPCNRPEALREPFYQPFDGRQTTLERDAPNVQCDSAGRLIGAPVSDHGHVIIGPLFDVVSAYTPTLAPPAERQQPGRVATDAASGRSYQDEHDYAHMCAQREANGHNSGMGEIFRRVAAIAPLKTPPNRFETPALGAPPASDERRGVAEGSLAAAASGVAMSTSSTSPSGKNKSEL